MPTSDPMDILLLHDKWGTDQILAASDPLSPEQLDQKFEIGPGSLRKTLTHMISAMNAWTDTLTRRPMRARYDQSGVTYSTAELRQMHEASAAEFMDVARKFPLDEIVARIREGVEYSFTRGVVITHIATHGMHHRAQCLNMLKHLGVSPLPPSSVVEWARSAG